MQKLARAVIGTNNMDNCSRYCQAPATTGLFRTVGYGGDSGSITDIEKAGLVLIVGSNTAESHPVLATRVKRAHKMHGQKLIVSDLRENEMARARGCVPASASRNRSYLALGGDASTFSTTDLPTRNSSISGSTVPMSTRRAWIHSRSKWPARGADFPIETLTKVAHMIAEAEGVCVLWAMGVTQHAMGSDTSTAISNLLLATGNYMQSGNRRLPSARA